MHRASRILAVALAALLLIDHTSSAQNLAFSLFERYLEPLRQEFGIPGVSAVIVQDGQILWERGFGVRDVEANLPARPDTPYYVADLSQTFAAVMVMKCVERGELRLSDPIGNSAPSVANPQATIRQLLSHTPGPGTTGFRYEPARFALLTHAIDRCMDVPYRKALATEILDRMAMIDAVPGRDIGETPLELRQLFSDDWLEHYAATLQRVATPYRVDRRGRATRSEPPPIGFDAARGLIASARDLAEFDRGLTERLLLRADTLEDSWTNVTSNGGQTPMGLGWFVQFYQGERIVWHFGSAPDAYSSLILTIPARRLTLILLANSDGLSVPFAMSDGDVTSSVFARTFLRLFL